jgi:hypothetical protein
MDPMTTSEGPCGGMNFFGWKSGFSKVYHDIHGKELSIQEKE